MTKKKKSGVSSAPRQFFMVQRSLWLYLTYASQAIWGLSGKEGWKEKVPRRAKDVPDSPNRHRNVLEGENYERSRSILFGWNVNQFAIKNIGVRQISLEIISRRNIRYYPIVNVPPAAIGGGIESSSVSSRPPRGGHWAVLKVA